MKKNFTCIICPMGCSLIAEKTEDAVHVSGNTCPKGAEYARAEMTNPVRTVTATVRCGTGRLSVKTDRPISKDSIFLCMEKIHAITAKPPVRIGDILEKDVCGANIVATQQRK